MRAVIFLTIFTLYWTPTIIASIRHHQTASVAVINAFLGWAVVGWIVALAMSVRDNRPSRTMYVP